MVGGNRRSQVFPRQAKEGGSRSDHQRDGEASPVETGRAGARPGRTPGEILPKHPSTNPKYNPS